MTYEVENRLTGRKPSTGMPIFSAQDHATATYVRSLTCFLAGVNLTALSPWNSTGGAQRAGVAISPKHVVYAAHFSLGVGATIRFVTAANVVVTRTIAAETQIPGLGQQSALMTDFIVARLDSALPVSIEPMRLMPLEFTNKYRRPPEDGAMIVLVNQEEKATVKTIRGSAWQDDFTTFTWDQIEGSAWSPEVISGDSGSPVFAILGAKAILLSTTHGSGGGWSVPIYAAAIQAIVEGGGESVIYADISGFDTLYEDE